MPFIRALRLGLTLPLLCAALSSVACGDEDEDQPEATEGDPAMGEREGPAGCYIGAQRACDCDVVEVDCTEAIGGQWVPQGCGSCE